MLTIASSLFILAPLPCPKMPGTAAYAKTSSRFPRTWYAYSEHVAITQSTLRAKPHRRPRTGSNGASTRIFRRLPRCQLEYRRIQGRSRSRIRESRSQDMEIRSRAIALEHSAPRAQARFLHELDRVNVNGIALRAIQGNSPALHLLLIDIKPCAAGTVRMLMMSNDQNVRVLLAGRPGLSAARSRENCGRGCTRSRRHWEPMPKQQTRRCQRWRLRA